MRPSGQQVKSDSAHALCPTADWSTRLFNSNPKWPRPLSPSKEGHMHVSTSVIGPRLGLAPPAARTVASKPICSLPVQYPTLEPDAHYHFCDAMCNEQRDVQRATRCATSDAICNERRDMQRATRYATSDAICNERRDMQRAT